LGLLVKVEVLDKFLNENHLETEFTKEKFEYNGMDYDGKSINTKSYVQTHKLNARQEPIIEVEMVFVVYQIGAFKAALKDLKNSFVEEYSISIKPLIEKIAFGNSLIELLQKKREIFRNHKTGRRYAGLLSEFIKEVSTEYVKADSNEKSNTSFNYREQYRHRATLKKLFNVLIDYGLIGVETKELDFNRIFLNTEVKNPVRWTGSTSELKYFIELINREEFDFEDKKGFKWRIAAKCFLKISSNSLKKITYKDLRTYKITDKTRRRLDEILVTKVLRI